MTKKDTYEMVADTLIESLEESLENGTVLPWRKPWATIGGPRNAFTNRGYNGMNLFLLSITCQSNGWDDMRFATFNAIAKAGGKVKKGEHGTPVVLWKFFKNKDASTGKVKMVPYLRGFTVFNVKAQTEGLELPPVKVINTDERRSDIEQVFIDTGAEVKFGGDEAYYSIKGDAIHLPAFEAFKNASAFLATYAHELAHWTGAKCRLDRDLTGRFGTEAYAFEELVAEMSSAMMAAALGFDNTTSTQNNAAYLQSWIKTLKNDTRAAMKAASLANAVVRSIIKQTATDEDETQEQEAA